jgi:hypothetical protein
MQAFAARGLVFVLVEGRCDLVWSAARNQPPAAWMQGNGIQDNRATIQFVPDCAKASSRLLAIAPLAGLTPSIHATLSQT